MLLPAYNEAQNLPALLADLDALATVRPLRVLVIDDGSRDGTGEVAGSWGGPSRPVVVAHGENRGLGAALCTGVGAILDRCGMNDVIVTMDADGSHRPHQIPEMVEEIEKGADVVIASRYRRASRVAGVPPVRRLESLCARILLSALFPVEGVRDYTCGYRAYRADILRRAQGRYGPRWISSRGFAATAELLLTLRPLRPTVREIPIDLRYDLKRGASKMVPSRTVREYLAMIIRLLTS